MEDIKEVNKALKVLYISWIFWLNTCISFNIFKVRHSYPTSKDGFWKIPTVLVSCLLNFILQTYLYVQWGFCSDFLGSYLAEGWWSNTLQAMWKGILYLKKEGKCHSVDWGFFSPFVTENKNCAFAQFAREDQHCFNCRSCWHNNCIDK